MNKLGILLHMFSTCMIMKSIHADKNQSQCPGPLAFYNAIGCEPIGITSTNSCAYQYNCDEMKSLPFDKCHVNRHAYDIGETLRDEDANPCDIGCICRETFEGISQFSCTPVDCFQAPVKEGCYRKNSPLDCCPGEEVCPEQPEDRATCNVNGKEYKDGEYFSVDSDPDLSCVCQPGYEGKNVEPFCVKPKRRYCDPLFSHPVMIKKNCAPVYYSSQSPQTDCSVFDRCQNGQDKVVKSKKPKDNKKDAVVCYFGSLVMQYGDELNQGTDYSSVCVKCVCEVGPAPTCQRLPDTECDVTNTPPFLNRLETFGSATIEKLRKDFPLHKN